MSTVIPPLPDAVAPPLRNTPSKLFVEVTTRCNLNCFMCVKQSGAGTQCDGDLSPELFSRLDPALANLEALILNGVGEPLLNPHLENFIRRAKMTMPAGSWIGFQSNGRLLTNLRALSLIEAGLDKICLSVDATSPEIFRKMREGSEVEDIKHAFAALASAKGRCNRPEVAVGVEFVVTQSNLAELPLVIRWAADCGASFAIATHLLPYNETHAEEAAYSACATEALALFDRYKEKAHAQGLDMYGYLAAKWKYKRTVSEQQLVDLVEEMKIEADRQNIFLDMKKLLQLDHARIEEVAEMLEKAKTVAMECGIELRLPEAALRGKRHCGFVEDGGAFITWDGDVSPCYFLWHRYNCFASGWHQQVEPKVFGNLNTQPILDIWNDAAFRSFRESVIKYDYPTCASCSLAPCDYVQTDYFEQDCHIRNVPCGACLWCMGVFQCLG
ncbi:MAG: radical SAM domain-containing [Geobacteraceae bacterium]|nr:MAG: radical SAM domain-containing [Geobacteraceae bacterium]